MQEQAIGLYAIIAFIIIFLVFIIPGIIAILAAGHLSKNVRASSIFMITAGLLVLVTLPFDIFISAFLANSMSVSDFAKFSVYKAYIFRALHYLALLSVSLGFLFISFEVSQKLKAVQEKNQ